MLETRPISGVFHVSRCIQNSYWNRIFDKRIDNNPIGNYTVKVEQKEATEYE